MGHDLLPSQAELTIPPDLYATDINVAQSNQIFNQPNAAGC
jgi:hypothetical protein